MYWHYCGCFVVVRKTVRFIFHADTPYIHHIINNEIKAKIKPESWRQITEVTFCTGEWCPGAFCCWRSSATGFSHVDAWPGSALAYILHRLITHPVQTGSIWLSLAVLQLYRARNASSTLIAGPCIQCGLPWRQLWTAFLELTKGECAQR